MASNIELSNKRIEAAKYRIAKCLNMLEATAQELHWACEAEGRLGNKSKSFTTKGRKWMYNPITKHKIYVKAIDIQHYLDIGYKFGIK